MFVNQHENRSSTGGSAGEEGLYYGTNTWGGGGQTEGTSRGSQRRGHGGGWRGAMPAPPLQAFPTGRDGTAQPSPPGARARARRDRGREAPPPAKRRAAASRAESNRAPAARLRSAASAAVPSPGAPQPAGLPPPSRLLPDLRQRPPPPRARPRPRPTPAAGPRAGPGRAAAEAAPPAARQGRAPGRTSRALRSCLRRRCSVRPAGPEPGSGAERRQSRYCHHRKLRRHLSGGRLRETCLPAAFLRRRLLPLAPRRPQLFSNWAAPTGPVARAVHVTVLAFPAPIGWRQGYLTGTGLASRTEARDIISKQSLLTSPSRASRLWVPPRPRPPRREPSAHASRGVRQSAAGP